MVLAMGDSLGLRTLLVRSGSRLLGLSIADVNEIMRPQPLEAFPAAPNFALGLSLIRGAPVPVIDLGRLLGESARAPGRFVLLRLAERTAVLAVSEVLGVRTVSEHAFTELPTLLSGAQQSVIEVVGQLDHQLFALLRASRIVPDELWGALEQRAAQP